MQQESVFRIDGIHSDADENNKMPTVLSFEWNRFLNSVIYRSIYRNDKRPFVRRQWQINYSTRDMQLPGGMFSWRAVLDQEGGIRILIKNGAHNWILCVPLLSAPA